MITTQLGLLSLCPPSVVCDAYQRGWLVGCRCKLAIQEGTGKYEVEEAREALEQNVKTHQSFYDHRPPTADNVPVIKSRGTYQFVNEFILAQVVVEERKGDEVGKESCIEIIFSVKSALTDCDIDNIRYQK